MLVVTVYANEAVAVGPDIKVYNNNDHDISLGIEAPKDVRIVRASAKNREPAPSKQ